MFVFVEIMDPAGEKIRKRKKSLKTCMRTADSLSAALPEWPNHPFVGINPRLVYNSDSLWAGGVRYSEADRAGNISAVLPR